MTSRRVLKAAEAIREVVSTTILMELKDPRIQDVTVTYVEVSPDMKTAKVHVSIMGNEAKQRLSLHGLQSAAGFLQSKIAKRIDTRYTPRLQFLLDQGVKHSIEVARILRELYPPASETPTGADEEAPDEEAPDETSEDSARESAAGELSEQTMDVPVDDSTTGDPNSGLPKSAFHEADNPDQERN